MHYTIFISNAGEHFIGVRWVIDHDKSEELQLQLPAWRPGRYELANYAKNIRGLAIHDNKGKRLWFSKVTKDLWRVNATGVSEVVVTYEYYANQYDAGASYADNEQLYVNPVNCLMYVVDRMKEQVSLTIDVPQDYRIACALPAKANVLHAPDFDTLADSPFIASAKLVHESFDVDGCTLHFWFMGKPYGNMKQLIDDTEKYTRAQVKLFGDMPCSDYHFLYHVLETPFRHGVEHSDSTVISVGPSGAWDDPGFYNDFIAISSHELFHLWNVKRIRPQSMLPYDYTRENYSELGYIYEGITTYYGDLVLYRCGVWSFGEYMNAFTGDIQKHFQNPGRFNYSVAESSFDTWLDGYVKGVQGRKVSIYTEGMLAAFIADTMLIKATNGKYRLDDAMRILYQTTYKQGKGYTEEVYRRFLEETGGISFEKYFEEVIHGRGMIETWLHEALSTLGMQLSFSDDSIQGTLARVSLLPPGERDNDAKRFFEIWSEKL